MLGLTIILLCAMLAGCAGKAPDFQMPSQVEGSWNGKESRTLSIESAPEPARALGLVRVLRTDYEGTPTVRATVYEMKAETGAFELMQKWRREPGTLSFHRSRFLVVVESPSGDVSVLNRFARAFERLLPEH